ncbi:MAG: lamin tail domain-containing protein, partial [Myxococcales bacterium]|nr:lamin tail domain-containing protein [Myxococcales bacterium]
YYEGLDGPEGDHRGTPGGPNPACPDRDVDYCRLQHPLDLEAEAGSTLRVFGIVFEEGITTRTPQADPDPALIGMVGYGPDGVAPTDAAWRWSAAMPNPGWDGDARGEPNNDEYLGDLSVPGIGTYDFAYRFSRDGGQTWLYCDRGDGSTDGYQPAAAGQLTSIAPAGDPCDPNPCDAPPPPACDGDQRVTFAAPGACRVQGGLALCDYAPTAEDCPGGQACRQGACVEVFPRPAPGEVVITEIMADPHDGLDENTAEWFEVHNTGDRTVGLEGCVVSDSADNATDVGPLNLAPGAYAIFVRSADPALNGGLDADATFGFGLNNGGDTVRLWCGDVDIDAVAYGAGWPAAPRAAISLDPAATDAALNDAPASWCLAMDVYTAVPAPHVGTPGRANPPCPAVDLCEPNPCDAPPAPTCDGGDRVVFEGPGQCSVVDGDTVDCSYARRVTRCPDGVCRDGACVAAEPAPAMGEVVFTEVMYDPHDPLADETAEWFELTNLADGPRRLEGCVIEDAGGNLVDVGPLTLPPGGVALFARADDAGVNGGLAPDHLFAFALNNGSETLALRCAGVDVDVIAWDEANGWPDARRASLSLDAARYDADANDDAASWCLGFDVYAPGGAPGEDHRGTPGEPNPPCPEADACAPNPCTTPPLPTCEGNTAVTFAAVGDCADVDGAADCTYAPQRAECGGGE